MASLNQTYIIFSLPAWVWHFMTSGAKFRLRTSMRAVFVFIFLLCTLSTYLFAAIRPYEAHVAEVTMVKGKVSMLYPWKKVASIVKMGDKVYEFTSVVTLDKSVISFKFKNGSVVTLGQKSKILVTKVKNSQSTLIGLLTGKIRARVIKKEKNKNKLFVKTKSAAIGVRGTDFHTVFNPQNKITSLITFEGEVAMKKIAISKETEINLKNEVLETEGLLPHKKTIATDDIKDIEKVLNSGDVVVVKKGRYAGVVAKHVKASVPVKISPVQFLALEGNDTLEEVSFAAKKEIKKYTKEEILKVAREINDIQSDDAPRDGFYNKETGEYAPKSGGLLDPNTGIYIQPPKNAKFDESTNNYVMGGKLGTITALGDYVAPEGLTLSATRGFIFSDSDFTKKANSIDKEKLLAMNDNIQGSLSDSIYKRIEKSWLPGLRFTLLYGPTSNQLDVADAPANTRNNSSKSKNGRSVHFEWRQLWTEKFNTYAYIDRKNITHLNKIGTATEIENTEEGQINWGLNLSYKFLNSAGMQIGFQRENVVFPRLLRNNGEHFVLATQLPSTRVLFGFNFHIVETESFEFTLSPSRLILFGAEQEITTSVSREKLKIESGRGYQVRAQGSWEFIENKYVSVYFNHRAEKQSLLFSSRQLTESLDIKRKSTDIGIGLAFGI